MASDKAVKIEMTCVISEKPGGKTAKDEGADFVSIPTKIITLIFSLAAFMLVFGLDGCKIGASCDLSTQLGLPGPSGYVFAVLAVFVGATLCGQISEKVGMPPLVGMMVGGFILRNAGGGFLTAGLLPFVTGFLRNGALVVILIRAGMGLDLQALRANATFLGVISVVPCLVEAATVMFVASWIFPDFDMKWGLLLGFLLADVSPAVTVPLLLDFQLKKIGTKKGIPSVLLAGGANNSVIAIVGYGIIFSLVFSSDRPIWMIVTFGAVEIVGGALLGVLMGLLITSKRLHGEKNLNSAVLSAMIGTAGVILVFGAKMIAMPGGGCLGVLTMGMTIAQCSDGCLQSTNQVFNLLWKYGGQTMLFGLLGASISLEVVDLNTAGFGMVIIFVGLLLRGIAMAFCVHFVAKDGWNLKEKIFAAITWCPKATVQAALSTVALDHVTSTCNGSMEGACGEDHERSVKLLTLAVLSIIVTAPAFAALISWGGNNLLEKEVEESDDIESPSLTAVRSPAAGSSDSSDSDDEESIAPLGDSEQWVETTI